MRNYKNRLSAAVLSLILMLSLCMPIMSATAADTGAAGADSAKTESAADDSDYMAYAEKIAAEKRPAKTAKWSAPAKAAMVSDVRALTVAEGKSVTLDINVPEAGAYAMTLKYCALGTGTGSVHTSVKVNGAFPFSSAENISLGRFFVNDGTITKDVLGNQLAPYQITEERWQTAVLNGDNNYAGDYYEWVFRAGVNKITLEAVQGDFAVAEIEISQPEKLMSYKEYTSAHSADPNNSGSVVQTIEAETADAKSGSALSPESTNNDPSVSPSHPYLDCINSIGGENWSGAGEWLEWTIDVPESGYYTLGFRFKQSFLRGINIFRRIMIDGKVPFSEADCVEFAYANRWQFKELEQAVYLEKGSHKLRLEIPLGDKKGPLAEISAVSQNLNDMYQRIIMITGVSPDPYNDYFLHKQIPELIDVFTENADRLEKISAEMESGSGSATSSLLEMVRLLRQFIKDPDTISDTLSTFESNIRTLYSVQMDLSSQPMLLDYITVRGSESEKIEARNPGFFETVSFRFQSFLHSFVDDEKQLAKNDKVLNVWLSANDITMTGVSSGRDQAVTIKRLVDETFTAKTGIPVKVNLINVGEVMLAAVASGNVPDVAMFIPKASIYNMSIRGGIDDLSKCKYWDEWQKRVYPSAFISYRYNNGVYGMPELQTFNLLYYRKDIMKKLGLSVPQTWDDVYDIAAALQGNHLEIGIPVTSDTVYMFLFQRGGQLFDDQLTEAQLTSKEFVDAFEQWCDFYKTKGVSLSYDFFNRFRSGQMPLGIASLTMYNQLAAAAPEIANLWDIAPIPGTVQEDGTINRSQGCNTTASIVFRDSKLKDEAYAFIDWWTSPEIQTRFGQLVEGMMGVSSRYYSANIESISQSSWTQGEMKTLEETYKYLSDVPLTEVNYYLDRNINNAFRRVTYYSDNPQEALIRYSKELNDEFARKRKEFNR